VDLIDTLLADQSDLSAVERFAQFHADEVEPLQSRFYSALLPATAPGPGQQYGFEVDLDRCSGCKACVAACHALNGLDESEAWRDVGLLVGGTWSLPVLQHVTSSCHHCLEPACLTACPVDAYEKDPITGIVRHLDDQCFGCQYCTLACPYDVPKFHPGKGIVRKCDMCGDRLRAGEAPACVQACPHEAIRIRVVDHADVSARAESGEFLPTVFAPSYTRPTTRFYTSRPEFLRELVAADAQRLVPEHGHTPLVVMLVMTQLSVGGFLVELIVRSAELEGISNLVPVALTLGYVGLCASLKHLGRPLYAYRALIGVRHSWLSREVVAFGSFVKLATAYFAATLFAPVWLAGHPVLRSGLLAGVVAVGMSGVGCSVMVYHVVRRPFWRAPIAGVKFMGTTLILGLATALACLVTPIVGTSEMMAGATRLVPSVAGTLMVVSAAKLLFEAKDWRRRDGYDPLERTARLLRGLLKRSLGLRRFLGFAGGLVLPALAVVGTVFNDRGVVTSSALLALGASLGGELVERSLFFRAVTRPKMPGGLPS
jgi:Fe-S-cluster-containing dehydrogenase component/DMSO reductase anchor subunit